MTAIAPSPLSTLSTSATSFPGGWLPAHVDVEKMTVRLCLTHRKLFPFLHGGVLHGLLCRLFDHDLPPGLLPWSPESGRLAYEAGDGYLFTLTLRGPARRCADAFESRLQSAATEPWRRKNRTTLGGNFVVEGITRERTTLPPLEDEIDQLALSDAPLRLRFVSPLRLKRPAELTMAGAGYVDGDCFPAGHFLRRLYQRWHLLQRGVYPEASQIPETPPAAMAEPRSLVWVDQPVFGSNPDKRMTLGGVLGEVELSGLTPPWKRLLAAMQLLHTGANTRYGFGRYVIDGFTGAWPDTRSRSYLEALASRRRLAEAADREARRGGAGIDGMTPSAFLAGGVARLDTLADELRTGRFCPDPLRLVDGHGVPTVRDRIVQRALVESLREPVRELQRLRRRGQNLRAEELSALLPFEPAVQLLRSFSEAPVYKDGRRIERPAGLRVVSPLGEWLGSSC